ELSRSLNRQKTAPPRAFAVKQGCHPASFGGLIRDKNASGPTQLPALLPLAPGNVAPEAPLLRSPPQSRTLAALWKQKNIRIFNEKVAYRRGGCRSAHPPRPRRPGA